MYKITFTIVLIAFLGMSALCVHLIKEKNSEYKELVEIPAARSFEMESMEKAFMIQLLNANFSLKDLQIKDLKGEDVQLKDIVKGEPFLFVRFSELHCQECVEFILNKARRLSNQMGYSDKVVLLATYEDTRMLKVVLKNMEIPFPVFLVDSLNIPCEDANFPYCFICDSTLQTSNVFIPDKNEKKLTNKYFELLQLRYFNSSVSFSK